MRRTACCEWHRIIPPVFVCLWSSELTVVFPCLPQMPEERLARTELPALGVPVLVLCFAGGLRTASMGPSICACVLVRPFACVCVCVLCAVCTVCDPVNMW